MTAREYDGLRTLLIGIDGASPRLLHSMFEDGLLPNLETVFDDSAAGALESQIPPWTPSAWPSIYTGVNPGKHGAFDFLTFDGYDWGLVSRIQVREHAIWELLDRRGLSSVVVNVPITHPPKPFDGALVPGYVAPDSPTCHPEGLLSDLRDALGDYRIYSPRHLSPAEQRDWYGRLIEMRGRAFRYLVERFEPSFGFVQFQQTDTVYHERPNDPEANRSVFTTLDDEIRRLIETCSPGTVVIVSDHGIGPYSGYEFRVNEFLREQGYLRTTAADGGMPSWTELAAERRSGGGPDPATKLVRALAAVGVTSQRIQRVLATVGLDEYVAERVPSETVRAGSERVDFAASTAYMRSRTELGVRINKAGREPDGVVSPLEFEAIRDDLIQELSGVRTPAGDSMFEAVLPREDVYSGPHVEDAVDIVTIPAEFDHFLTASLRGDVFAGMSERWNHKRHGVIAAAGAGVDTGGDLWGAHIYDVAPTVLATLETPPSTRMDGRPLGIVDAKQPIEYAPYTNMVDAAASTGEVQQRLADLGYLEDDEY